LSTTAPTDTSCRFVADGQPRLLNNAHLRDCNLSGCPGCKPCTENHCSRCGRTHLDDAHPRTCPTCIYRTRQDILGIVDQVDEAYRQHLHRSIASMAFMISAPAGNYEAHYYVTQSAVEGRLCRCQSRGITCPSTLRIYGPACEKCDHRTCRLVRKPPTCPDEAWILEDLRQDYLHPATVLGGWDMLWRQYLDHDPEYDDHDNEIQTIESTSTYLLRNLTYMAQAKDTDLGIDFPAFARAVRRSREWLEEVLRTGTAPTRMLCTICGETTVERIYDTTDEGTPFEETRLEKVYDDVWQCKSCGQTWDPKAYTADAKKAFAKDATRLPIRELSQRIRVPAGTIRTWTSRTRVVLPDGTIRMDPPRLRSVGKWVDGRMLYSVEKAERLRDAMPRHTENRA